jgi:hypothetical protein
MLPFEPRPTATHVDPLELHAMPPYPVVYSVLKTSAFTEVQDIPFVE